LALPPFEIFKLLLHSPKVELEQNDSTGFRVRNNSAASWKDIAARDYSSEGRYLLQRGKRQHSQEISQEADLPELQMYFDANSPMACGR
jgi:hypothetical protein